VVRTEARARIERPIFIFAVALALVAVSYEASQRPAGQASTPQPATASQRYAPSIDPAEFTSTIDNPYLPLLPGSRWVYGGLSGKRCEIDTVTD
jgi:hypothetical protein